VQPIRLRHLLPLLVAGTASADPTSGVDVALFRSSYDAGGMFSLENGTEMRFLTRSRAFSPDEMERLEHSSNSGR